MIAPENDPQLAVSDVVAGGDVLMLTSTGRERDALGSSMGPAVMSARPITSAEVAGDRISALVSARSPWVADLAARPGASVVLTLDRGGRYAALTGTATLDDDTARIASLWNHAAEAFVAAPDDPNARILDVEVSSGEWWRAPVSGIGTALSVVGEIVLGRPASAGARGPIVTDGADEVAPQT